MPSYSYSIPDIASIGRLLGDNSRAAMVVALMDGRAWTIGELGAHIGIAKSTATEHAHRLVTGGICQEAYQGRHRYLRLAGPRIAEAIEALGTLSATMLQPSHTLSAGSRDESLRAGRTCYRHLAGRLGVRLFECLVSRGVVTRDWDVGPDGAEWFSSLGISPKASSRPALRPCLDWTERRDHLAGSYGDALCDYLLAEGWVERYGTARAVRLTGAGASGLARLGIRL